MLWFACTVLTVLAGFFVLMPLFKEPKGNREIEQETDRFNAVENQDEAIEKDIAARKLKLYGSGPNAVQSSSSCPSCGAQIIPGKKFCADCGHRL